MKRLGRILGVAISAVSLLLLIMLLAACVWRDSLGIRYQRTEIRTTPRNESFATSHFYSAGLRSWRIALCDWHDQDELIRVRVEREVWGRAMEYSSINAGRTSNPAAKRKAQDEMNLAAVELERLDKQHVLDGDGWYIVLDGTIISPSPQLTKSFAGIKIENAINRSIDSESRRLTIPVWFVASLLLVMPLVQMLALWRSWNRRRHSLCTACAYDLRASRERCPECGQVLVARSTTAATKVGITS
jgi:hypothetical protein